MHKCVNGWTKEKMLKVINDREHDGPSMVSGQCAYHASDGNKCGVGLFIPDGHEGCFFHGYFDDLITEYPDLQDLMPLASGMFELQKTHDLETTSIKHHGGNAKAAMIDWVKKNVE